MERKNRINSNREIELINVFKIFIKRKWSVLIPTFLITFITLVFLILNPARVKIDGIIDTRNLVEIISHIDENIKQFTLEQYNIFIEPINNLLENDGKKLSIEIRDRDLMKISKLNELNIYSLTISKTFRNREDGKQIFEKIIENIYEKFESIVFRRYFFGQIEKKLNLQKNIYKLKKEIELNNKYIKAIKKYLNLNEKNFISSSKNSDTYLPPSQKFIGLNIKRDLERIRLNRLVNDLEEIIEETDLIKNKKISDFSSLIKLDKIKNFKFYNDLKIYPEEFISLKEKTLANINLSDKRSPIIVITILVFVLSIFLFMMLSFFREWREIEKNNEKK